MKKAIIYVRGNNKEMQEVYCKLYAAEAGYKILFVTDDIEKVSGCDVLLISNPTRISRNSIKYYETVNEFKKKERGGKPPLFCSCIYLSDISLIVSLAALNTRKAQYTPKQIQYAVPALIFAPMIANSTIPICQTSSNSFRSSSVI